MTETETETFSACPNCDSSHIYQRTPSVADSPRRSEKAWYCADCRHDFETPDDREKKYNTGPSYQVADLVGAAVEDEEGKDGE